MNLTFVISKKKKNCLSQFLSLACQFSSHHNIKEELVVE